MKWVPKLPDCPLTLAMKFDLIPSTWHTQKSQTSFDMKTCFSWIHLLILPTVFSSPKHSSGHVTPLVKTLPSTGSQYPKKKFKHQHELANPVVSYNHPLLPSPDLAHPLSPPPCPDAPWAPQPLLTTHWCRLFFQHRTVALFCLGNSCLWCTTEPSSSPQWFLQPSGQLAALLCPWSYPSFTVWVNQWINYLGTVWEAAGQVQELHQHL